METEETNDHSSDQSDKYRQIIKTGLIIISLGMLCLIFMFSYVDIQRLIFSSKETILFIDNHQQGLFCVFLLGALPLLMSLTAKYFLLNQESYIFKIVSNLKVAIITSILLIVLTLTVMFNSFSFIDDNEIVIKDNIFSSQRHYTFAQINHIDLATEYRHVRKRQYKRYVNYIIHFEDNSAINITSPIDFWKKISEVDDLFIKNNVKVNREVINNEKYIELVLNYYDPNNGLIDNTLQKLFKFKPTFN